MLPLIISDDISKSDNASNGSNDDKNDIGSSGSCGLSLRVGSGEDEDAMMSPTLFGPAVGGDDHSQHDPKPEEFADEHREESVDLMRWW